MTFSWGRMLNEVQMCWTSYMRGYVSKKVNYKEPLGPPYILQDVTARIIYNALYCIILFKMDWVSMHSYNHIGMPELPAHYGYPTFPFNSKCMLMWEVNFWCTGYGNTVVNTLDKLSSDAQCSIIMELSLRYSCMKWCCIVFAGPVHWTENMTKTELNPTAKDWTAGCSCTDSKNFQLPVARSVEKWKDRKRLVQTGCNQSFTYVWKVHWELHKSAT